MKGILPARASPGKSAAKPPPPAIPKPPPPASRIITIYAEQVTAPDGTVTVKPLRSVVPNDEIEIAEAAKICGLSERRLQYLCECGDIKSARKPGGREKSRWHVSRAEILQLRNRQEVGL